MAKIESGKLCELLVTRREAGGVILDAGPLGEVELCPGEVQPACEVGERLEVFLFHGEGDVVQATTRQPLAQVGRFAYLEVAAVTSVGAFLRWGPPRDLLVPFREQRRPLEFGRSYIVHVHHDKKAGRPVASTRLDRFLDNDPVTLEVGQRVDLLITGRTDLGFKAIINDAHWGLLFHGDLSAPLRRGQRLPGYVKGVRGPGKIDLSLHRPGPIDIPALGRQILATVQEHEGFLAVTDRSPPGEIRDLFGVSKKTFKKALGNLYRQGLITLEREGLRAIAPGETPAADA